MNIRKKIRNLKIVNIIMIILIILIVFGFSIKIITLQAKIINMSYVLTQTVDRVTIYSKYIYMQERIIIELQDDYFESYDEARIRNQVQNFSYNRKEIK